ncbi:MAG: outer membrane beta-barrel protein [Helicobacteraceae bacterium]|nr:outer membrane beta-barrel protein [Helicobacteraceae bacterium]
MNSGYSDLYIGGKLWLAKLEIKDVESVAKSGTPIVLTIGKHLSNASPLADFRAEFELTTEQKYSEEECHEDEDSYIKACAKVAAKVQWTAMVNGFVDLRISEIVSPYFGLGVGFASLEAEAKESAYGHSDSYSEDINAYEMTFGYQIMFGVAITPNRNFSIDVGYKIADYGNLKDENEYYDIDANFKSSGLYIGANYIF